MQLTGTVRSLALTCTGKEISADDVKKILAMPMPVESVPSAPINMPLREARDLFEKSYFEQLIDHERGNMTRVAERAGLERTHLYRKLKLLGIKLRSH
jgi:DNA-binding NtrC family response regulator